MFKIQVRDVDEKLPWHDIINVPNGNKFETVEAAEQWSQENNIRDLQKFGLKFQIIPIS